MATMKETLREWIERLEDDKVLEVLDYTRELLANEDTEPLSDREQAEITEAKNEQAQAGGKTLKAVRRDLGLCGSP